MVPARANANNVTASSAAVFTALMCVVAQDLPCLMVSTNESVAGGSRNSVLFRAHDLDGTGIVDYVLGSFNGFVCTHSELRHRALARHVWIIGNLEP